MDAIKIKTGRFETFSKDLQKQLLKLTLPRGCTKPFIKQGKWYPYAVVAIVDNNPVGWCFLFPKRNLKKRTENPKWLNDTLSKKELIANQIHFFISPKWRNKGVAKLLAKRMIKYIHQYRKKDKTRIMPWDTVSTTFFNWFKTEAETRKISFLTGWGEDYWTSFTFA